MFNFNVFRSLAFFSLGGVLFLLPTEAEARTCQYYVDQFGRTRERCTGLLGGSIAGIVVGGILGLLVLMGITQLIRRRRQRANALPVVANAGYYGPPPTMGQPPNYPPPNFPPPAQQPTQGSYQGSYQEAPQNHYQPPPGPPPGEKYDGNPHGGVQMPMPAANHS